jgi:putative membrane protein
MFLTRAETDAIDQQTARLESRTGVEVVTAVIGKSDVYAELPWKAFALGASLAGFAAVLGDALWPQWITANTPLIQTTTILGVGAASALAAIVIPPFARLFLAAARRDAEVRQYAQSLFLTRELFKTRGRMGVLILVSVFERRVEILPDIGLHARIGATDWDSVIASMTPRLSDARPFHALQEGLATLEALLVSRGFQPGADANELADRTIEERGV